MAKGFASEGWDFDDLFDPDIVGDGPTEWGMTSDGAALRYAKLSYGSKRADVGYWVEGIGDVSNLWAAKGTAQYTIPGVPNVSASDAALTNQPNVTATAQISLRNDGKWYTYAGNSKGQQSASNGTWNIFGGSAGEYEALFVVNSNTGHASRTVGNNASGWRNLGDPTQSTISLTLPTASANNANERTAALNVTMHIRRASTGQILGSTTRDLSCYTLGYL